MPSQTNQAFAAAVSQTLAELRTPDGLGAVLDTCAVEWPELSRGQREVLRGIARRVRRLRPAEPAPNPSPIEAGCTGSIDPDSGLLQHPGESCPVHDADTDPPCTTCGTPAFYTRDDGTPCCDEHAGVAS